MTSAVVSTNLCGFIRRVEAALLASLVVVDVIAGAVAPLEHPICFFHVIPHDFSIRTSCPLALASTRRATDGSLESWRSSLEPKF